MEILMRTAEQYFCRVTNYTECQYRFTGHQQQQHFIGTKGMHHARAEPGFYLGKGALHPYLQAHTCTHTCADTQTHHPFT